MNVVQMKRPTSEDSLSRLDDAAQDSSLEHIAVLIQKVARYKPLGKLIGIALEWGAGGKGKLPQKQAQRESSSDKDSFRAAPIITFDIPPASEALPEDSECAPYVQAVCEQFDAFLVNCSVRKIGIVWFCDRTLRDAFYSSWLSVILEIFQNLLLGAEEKGVGISLMLTDDHLWADGKQLLSSVAGYETESGALRHCEQCAEILGRSKRSGRVLRHFTKHQLLLRSGDTWKRAEEKGIVHCYSDAYREFLARDMPDSPVNIAQEALEWASRRASPEFLDKVKASYIRAHRVKRPPSATAWNNALQKMSIELEEGCDMERALDRVAGDARRIGLLLAHLSWQRTRDRVILYAVHPQLDDILRISHQQIVKLMGEASERAPDASKAQGVAGLLAYLSAFAPKDCAIGYAVMAYIQWWIGEGSNALQSVSAAQARDDQCSMACLVDYALRVQLPPPWVDAGDGERW